MCSGKILVQVKFEERHGQILQWQTLMDIAKQTLEAQSRGFNYTVMGKRLGQMAFVRSILIAQLKMLFPFIDEYSVTYPSGYVNILHT